MAEPAVNASAPEIPDKLYFRIGEVSRLAGIKPYVLRFWESEFPGLGPKKSGTGHRLYRRKDVELVLQIKRLLYEQRYTIEGARKALEGADSGAPEGEHPAQVIAPAKHPDIQQGELFSQSDAVQGIRRELQAILDLLR